MSFKPVTHVLFDMDGLILNTEDLYTLGFEEIASRYGKSFTYSLKSQIMGQQTKEFATSIIKALELPLSVDEFISETEKIFKELFPLCAVLPGVEKLIKHLCKTNIPIGLATSSRKETYELKTKNHKELFDLFPYKTFGSSDPHVKKGKPFPDIFFVAAAKFPDKPDPAKVLVFEDSVNGAKAAHSADMQVVLVPDHRLDRTLVPEATLIINSMEEFQPELFGLPSFEE